MNGLRNDNKKWACLIPEVVEFRVRPALAHGRPRPRGLEGARRRVVLRREGELRVAARLWTNHAQHARERTRGEIREKMQRKNNEHEGASE